MKKETQVCTIEQAKKLKELGINQDISIFYWFFGDTGTNTDHLILREPSAKLDSLCVAAFTVAELSVMLGDLEGLVIYDRERGQWLGEYQDPPLPTEAQAKAELLIKFLESEDDYVNPTVVNERLSA